MNRIAALTFVSLGSSLVACSSSNSTKPTAEQYDDTAQAIASQTSTSGGGGDVASMSDSVNIALGTMPLGFSLSGNGHFQGNRLGVAFDYAITCKNLAGVSLGRCDACFAARPPALAVRSGRHRVEYAEEQLEAMHPALRRALETSPNRVQPS